MSQHYDQYHDPGFGRLQHLLEAHPSAADRLKTAEIDDDGDALPPSAFAWPAQRLYPIHTPEQASLSHLYAKTSEVAVPKEVLAGIEEALDAYEIPRETFLPVVVKEAALAEDECLFPEQRSYPVRSAVEVKLAEERLLAQVGKMMPESRAAVFSRLAKFATRHGHALHPLSAKFAGLTETDPHTLRTALHARAGATKQAALAAKYVELADAIGNNPRSLRDHDTRVKIAETIGTLDETDPFIQRRYDKGIPDPLLSVFNTEKRADEASVACGNHSHSLTRLAALDPKFYGDALGDDMIPEITSQGRLDVAKLAQVLPTLPTEMQRVLCQALKSAGQ